MLCTATHIKKSKAGGENNFITLSNDDSRMGGAVNKLNTNVDLDCAHSFSPATAE
jgi:hypothetical protein